MSEEQKRPSLEGQFAALLRQGAKDLHNAVVPAFPDSARGVDELGTPSSPTPQMVTQDLGADKGYSAMLDSYASKPAAAQAKQQEIER
jgi:hypothetical protein